MKEQEKQLHKFMQMGQKIQYAFADLISFDQNAKSVYAFRIHWEVPIISVSSISSLR